MVALHLLKSALVHINTLLLQAVLEVPQFHDLLDDIDRRALSPLFWSHINRTADSGSTWTPGSTSPRPVLLARSGRCSDLGAV
jgi:hypothetical protein